jgi:hypothetical protein
LWETVEEAEMSSLRYQKMTSVKELERTEKEILKTALPWKEKQELIVTLRQHGRKAVPEIKKKLKNLKREKA